MWYVKSINQEKSLSFRKKNTHITQQNMLEIYTYKMQIKLNTSIVKTGLFNF